MDSSSWTREYLSKSGDEETLTLFLSCRLQRDSHETKHLMPANHWSLTITWLTSYGTSHSPPTVHLWDLAESLVFIRNFWRKFCISASYDWKTWKVLGKHSPVTSLNGLLGKEGEPTEQFIEVSPQFSLGSSSLKSVLFKGNPKNFLK